MWKTLLKTLIKWAVQWNLTNRVSVSIPLDTVVKPLPEPQHPVYPPILPPDELRSILKAEVKKPKYKRDKWTYCNKFVHAVCIEYGWKDFGGMRAGEMMDLMIDHPRHFKPLWSHRAAAEWAVKGALVIAARKAKPVKGNAWAASGHVCIVAPEPKLIYSGKWAQKVAQAANVGSVNWYGRGLNFAFRDRPRLFLHLG